jgi:hypothetical protein
MVKLCARAGRLADAAEYLTLLKGRSGYDEAAAVLHRAWLNEMRIPQKRRGGAATP